VESPDLCNRSGNLMTSCSDGSGLMACKPDLRSLFACSRAGHLPQDVLLIAVPLCWGLQNICRIASSCLRANHEKGTAAGAVRSDNKCLLDVGGFGWPGDENAKTGALETNAIISLLHVMNNLAGRHDQDKVLGHHEDRPMRTEGTSRHPHGTVLRDAELARDDGDVEPLEFVRILQSGEINIGPAYFWD
jgi:hypothetical protein